ncbi:hypothetical protein [Mesorhizobium sp.]|uniref:phage head spike fiber domain-containing protein n=1 Tax=Mesorhizobium sp. TaxID=1871066 RepID=UPI000FE8226B|nr:hypothetical protein [Mesorhizobium sp.]RWP06708.1 MAG: hypothetical protein EOQ99_09390 [Mesorhizobium sp.]
MSILQYTNRDAPFIAFGSRLGSRANGIAINFVDDTLFAGTGLHGSAHVRDAATPANNFYGSPADLLTYTTPTVKMVRGSDGLYRYQKHNLFLNSGAPVTQNVTTLTNATYQVLVTGAGTVTLTNAGTGVASAGSPVSFTAGSGLLTCTVAGGPTTVQVVRTPVDAGYVATAGATKFELPYEWDEYGNPLGILVEDQRVNIALWASDLTNAVWVKTNITAAKTATGITGVVNSATTITATGANGTALQTITSASAARITYCWIKRRTGTGVVEMTQDNGSTWAAVTVTADWTRVAIASATLANPIVGLRLVTSGDAVDVDFFQHVAASIVSSPIRTFAITATRTGDNISLLATAFPTSATAMTMGGQFETSKQANGARAMEILAATTANAAFFTVATANTSFNVTDVSVAQTLLTNTPYAAGDFLRISASAAANDFRCYRDGIPSSVNPDTSGTFFTSPIAKLAIGSAGAGTSTLEGHIKEVFYFPETSTNDELAELNTPVNATEIAQSIHLLGDSFLNGEGMLLYVANALEDKARSVSKDGVGGSSIAAQKIRFDATPWYYDHVLVIMDGGSSDTLVEAQTAIQAELAHLTHERWLFIEGGYTPGQDEIGMPARTVIDSIHNWIIATYPTHYVPTLTIMQTYSDGSPGDIAAVAAGLWPTSQTSDGLHPTTGVGSGQEHLSQIIVDAINNLDW